MTVNSSIVETSVDDVLRTVLENTRGGVFAIGLREGAMNNLVEILDEIADPPIVQIFAEESVLKWVRDDFLLATTVADLKAEEALSWRATDEPVRSTLIVTQKATVSVVPAGERIAGLLTDNVKFVEEAWEKWDEEWEDAEEFELRTPPRSEIHESLVEEIGSEVETDFRTMLDSLDNVRNDPDETAIALLAAAKNKTQLYEISRWGEDVGLASKATFSRAKNRLENQGLIETEKVPTDIGRPRLRLTLGDPQLCDADAKEFPSVARKLLSTTAT